MQNLAYKVVTSDLKSLGLRGNQNINKYSIGKWFYLPGEQVEKSSRDWGGIWMCCTMAGARKLRKYMQEKHPTETRIFKTALDKILYSNSYRIKTNGICMLEEVF